MWALMGVVKNEYGVFQVRKRVPNKLREAVAQVQGASKTRVSWLKRSLHTKDLREANILAKPILIEFDHVLAKAEALTAERPLMSALDDRRIEQIASYHFASILEEDEEVRRDGDGSQEVFNEIFLQLAEVAGSKVPAVRIRRAA
jgi:hypothetical protein